MRDCVAICYNNEESGKLFIFTTMGRQFKGGRLQMTSYTSQYLITYSNIYQKIDSIVVSYHTIFLCIIIRDLFYGRIFVELETPIIKALSYVSLKIHRKVANLDVIYRGLSHQVSSTNYLRYIPYEKGDSQKLCL